MADVHLKEKKFSFSDITVGSIVVFNDDRIGVAVEIYNVGAEKDGERLQRLIHERRIVIAELRDGDVWFEGEITRIARILSGEEVRITIDVKS